MDRFILALVLTGCLAAPVVAEDAGQLAAQARGVIRQHCHRCHNGEGSEGGDFDLLQRADLLSEGLTGQPIVAAGKPGESYLLERMVKGEMPPAGLPQLRPQDLAVLWQWIEAGAPEFPAAERREFIPIEAVLTAARDHLRRADREQRPYLRFFTLHHLHNHPQTLDADLRLVRAALSKAVNSLSWKPRVIVPQAVDEHRTLFVIDVRDFDWDRGDLWREVMRAYPYGLKYRNHPNEGLQRLDDDLCDLSGCDLPLVRADWFVASATRPPLYHTLLGLPKDAKELERKLGVDIPANFRSPTAERIARGGFPKSGVSGQNRLVERHDALYGAYWKSYDFLPDTPRTKLTRFPLGPLNLFPEAKHPYPHQAFEHDGGEIIFHLPNGLQGYLLVDGEDQRIDAGPIEAVNDALKTSGTPLIVNGLSCMTCHKHGMIPFKDTIRAGSAVFGEAERMVRRLYPEAAVMERLVEADSERFLAALEKAVGPFLREGADRGRPLRELPEPVGDVARQHRLGYLDLQTVACELDLEDSRLIRQGVGERNLKQLGLEALLQEGGVVSRMEWEAVDGVSLMQELARALRYTPFGMP